MLWNVFLSWGNFQLKLWLWKQKGNVNYAELINDWIAYASRLTCYFLEKCWSSDRDRNSFIHRRWSEGCYRLLLLAENCCRFLCTTCGFTHNNNLIINLLKKIRTTRLTWTITESTLPTLMMVLCKIIFFAGHLLFVHFQVLGTV